MKGYPVTIRFLDPPLHEFVPTEEEDIAALAETEGKTVEQIKNVIYNLHEFNPMMGHRGCRLAVSYPEIAEMQTRAVIKAALVVSARHPDWNLRPEIMIPLVGEVKELKFVKDVVVAAADKLIAESGSDLKYLVGTMIEIPRAALTADEIAKEAQFFARVDQIGVGKLVKMAATLGRATRPDLHLGVCGEHGGDPSSVEFFHKAGLDYVSCSPFRVPIARLAAAQAAIKEEEAKAAEVKAAEEEVNAKVEAAKAALKEATDKLSSVAVDASAELKDFAAVAFKSLKAGWDEAKKTFDQEKK